MMQPGYGAPMQPGYGPPPPMGQPVMIPPPGQPVMMQPQPMGPPLGMAPPGMTPPMGGGRGRLQLPLMPMPTEIPTGCPPGLAYLATLDHLFIRQCVEPLEILTGIETQNAYQVFANGFVIYWAQEQSDFCERQCCGTNRPFTMVVSDGTGAPVMRMVRPYRCTNTWCCFCCLQKMFVEAPAGNHVGTVEQRCSCCTADYYLTDNRGIPALRIDGPCCKCGHVEFKVRTLEDAEVGRVAKHWAVVLNEAFTDADNFGITFPRDLPVQMKAVILGACFLIDFMYFEESAHDN